MNWRHKHNIITDSGTNASSKNKRYTIKYGHCTKCKKRFTKKTNVYNRKRR